MGILRPAGRRGMGTVLAIAVFLGLGTAATQAAAASTSDDPVTATSTREYRLNTTAPRAFHGIASGRLEWIPSEFGNDYDVFVWDGFVIDQSPDGWGAVAYAEYDEWYGGKYVHRVDVMGRDCCYGPPSGEYEWVFPNVKNFYARVCLYQGAQQRDSCSVRG